LNCSENEIIKGSTSLFLLKMLLRLILAIVGRPQIIIGN